MLKLLKGNSYIYLPLYLPEFNPDEYLNQDYKRNANKNNILKQKMI